MTDFVDAVDGITGLSATLDNPLRRIRSAALRVADARATFREWKSEIEHLRLREDSLLLP